MVKFYSRHGLELLLCPKILWHGYEGCKLNTKIEKNSSDITDLETKTTATCTFASGFTGYNGSSAPTCYKKGNIVTISGIISPTSTLASGYSGTVFTVPEGYRPAVITYTFCHGSGMSSWLLYVRADGIATMQRYGTTEYTTCPTGAWMPITVTYVTS